MTGEAGGATVAPPVRGRVHYLLGGTLPERYRPWVLADCTGRGWRWRVAARHALLMAPFALVFLLLPGRIAVRVTMAACVMLAAAGAGVAAAGFFRNRRLAQHGLPPVVPREEDEEPAGELPSAQPPAGGADAQSASANASVGMSTRAASVIEPDSDG